MTRYTKKAFWTLFGIVAITLIVTPAVLVKTMGLACVSFYLEMKSEIASAVSKVRSV